jgi:protein-disulfide isomerase
MQAPPAAKTAAPAPQSPAPAPEAPKAAPAPPPFPPVDRANFTATSPSADTVEAFLKSSWGYDPNRLYQVQAILKTAVPGLTKVVVLVEEKGGQQQQPASLSFFVLPDGTHLIAGSQQDLEVLPFGADPYSGNRQTLAAKADGPSKGASSKSLEFVEFSDFQCPHCKEAQPTVDKLLKDYPTAHFVYENFPLSAIHPQAEVAAEYGVCVAKEGGSTAFFKFVDNIFDNQAKLTADGATDALKAAATAAGQDAAKTAACAALPETKASIDASTEMARDLGVNQTPTLFVNGRGLPLGGIPYETLKSIIDYQIKLDGVAAK